MDDKGTTEDVSNILNFLFWYEQEAPGVMWGGIKIGEAIESCRKLLGVDEDEFELLERISLGEPLPEGSLLPKTTAQISEPSQESVPE